MGGVPTIMKKKPSNRMIHLETDKGRVSLWAPGQKEYLMMINCHSSAISNIEIDRYGSNIITTGLDNKICIFDIKFKNQSY